MQQINKGSILYFYIVWLLFLIPATVYLLFYEKGDFSMVLNKLHNPASDIFFRYITWGGDFYIIVLICIILLLIRLQYAIITIFNSVFVFTIITALKNIFNIDRPSIYFPSDMDLHYVPGLSLYEHFSFPSGHTASAFCIYFTLAYFSKNVWMKSFLAFLAVLVAISRVYLMQHFLIDVYAGSIIAVLVTHTLMVYYSRKTKLLSNDYLRHSVLKRR
ncbi:MAG: phosphatase PAP2 family protein [Fimbriimonadaceae bacterium]|nr:phosphatase PAP2 family protein [Chitinophagales bacterium]